MRAILWLVALLSVPPMGWSAAKIADVLRDSVQEQADDTQRLPGLSPIEATQAGIYGLLFVASLGSMAVSVGLELVVQELRKR